MYYDPQRHRRRSIRLKGYDYTAPGAYYVTICVRNRQPILSQVIKSSVALKPAGDIADAVWRSIPRHFPDVTLDTFVIMPDHIHGIIILEGEKPSDTVAHDDRPKGTIPGSLPAIVQNFKSVSARRINQWAKTPGNRVWQEDYYEHIVRDENDLERIRRYIAANPARWRR